MTFKDKLIKLVDVKSIVTILLASVFCYLAIIERVSADQFLTIFTVVISFFFGVKSGQETNSK